ncbi:MAG: dUTP diphosphatase [Oscillospiraceae bacterium]|nr:dUTP diphosphatase [Oscillospiraceae bacterium]
MKFKKLRPDARTPAYGSAAAAGADLYICSDHEISIMPGETVLLPTGLAVAIPNGYVGLIFARSSLGTKKGLAPANKVGVIDADYRGEILISLHNHSSEKQTLAPYERVAQMVIVPFLQVSYEETEELDDTARGAGGFGSTGSV